MKKAAVIAGVRLREGPGETYLIADTAKELPLDLNGLPKVQIPAGPHKGKARLFHAYVGDEAGHFFGVELHSVGGIDESAPHWVDIANQEDRDHVRQITAELLFTLHESLGHNRLDYYLVLMDD